MSNDKHQALRDALGRCTFVDETGYADYSRDDFGCYGEADPHNVRALLADHDHMKQALQRIIQDDSWDFSTLVGIAYQTLKECEQ